MPQRAASRKKKSSRKRVNQDPLFDQNDPSLAPSRWPSAGPSGGNVEYKNLDYTIASAFSTTAVLVLLNGTVQGTTPSTRIGRKLSIRRVDYVLTIGPTTTTVTDHCAFAFVVDRQPNGGAFNTTDFLASSTSLSLPNANEYQRFRTLARYDSTIVGSASGGPSSVMPSLMEKVPVSVPTFYNAGNAGTIGDIQSNAFYLFLIGSSAPSAANPALSGNVRVWYTDS